MTAPQPDLTTTDFGLGDLAAHVVHLLGPSWHHSDLDNSPTLHHADGTRVAFEPALSGDPDLHLLLLHMTAGDECETGEVYVHDEDETLSEVGSRTAAKVSEFRATQGQFGPAQFYGQDADNGTLRPPLTHEPVHKDGRTP